VKAGAFFSADRQDVIRAQNSASNRIPTIYLGCFGGSVSSWTARICVRRIVDFGRLPQQCGVMSAMGHSAITAIIGIAWRVEAYLP